MHILGGYIVACPVTGDINLDYLAKFTSAKFFTAKSPFFFVFD